jgi:hypothetical protein
MPTQAVTTNASFRRDSHAQRCLITNQIIAAYGSAKNDVRAMPMALWTEATANAFFR